MGNRSIEHRQSKLIVYILYRTSGTSDLQDFVWEFNKYFKMVDMCRNVKIKLTCSCGQSTVCAWHEFGLTNKSGTWSSRVSNSCGRRTWFTPVRLLYGQILFKPSTTKNGRVITLEVLYKGKFTWLYGNMIFMMFCCSPS